MSTTDKLRAMLNDRGVEYETEDRPTIRYTEWGDWVFSEPLDAKPHTLGAQCELMRIPATPEQAIAATLGNDGVERTNDGVAERDQFKDENERLRELVRDMWGSGHPDRSCEGCDIRDECHDDTERLRKDGRLRFSRCLFELRIEDRMRELGIEVDE